MNAAMHAHAGFLHRLDATTTLSWETPQPLINNKYRSPFLQRCPTHCPSIAAAYRIKCIASWETVASTLADVTAVTISANPTQRNRSQGRDCHDNQKQPCHSFRSGSENARLFSQLTVQLQQPRPPLHVSDRNSILLSSKCLDSLRGIPHSSQMKGEHKTKVIPYKHGSTSTSIPLVQPF